MAAEEITHSPFPPRPSPRAAMLKESILTPRFRSAAALAGWDEEALLLATLVVEDTPDRQPGARRKKRLLRLSKSPPTSTSARKRRSRPRPEVPIPPVVLHLEDDEDEDAKEGGSVSKDSEADKKDAAPICCTDEENKNIEKEKALDVKRSSKRLPSMDRLSEELSCAICLEICFEPSTTACGHSFCMKCLKCAAAKCGNRCPKCRQLISNGRSYTVNTVLWNTIQLLFPEEVEARKDSINREGRTETNEEINNSNNRRNTRRSIRRNLVQDSQSERERTLRRRIGPSQSEDAALAFRLQREEFMVAFQSTHEQQQNTLYSARANLRTMTSRAVLTRNRDS